MEAILLAPPGSVARVKAVNDSESHGTSLTPEPLNVPAPPVNLVLLAEPRGFCAGVEMAIKALEWMVEAFPPPVYCYHEIVHNRLVVERFRDLGRDLRRRDRRRARGCAADVVGPRLRARSGRGRARTRPSGRERGVPARHQGAPRGQGPRQQGVHGVVRGPRGPRRSHRHPRRRTRRHAAGRTRARPRAGCRHGARPVEGRALGPDHVVAPRLAGRDGGCARTVPHLVDRVARRPLLRHHQPPAGAARHRDACRCHRGDRERQLVEHHRTHEGGA